MSEKKPENPVSKRVGTIISPRGLRSSGWTNTPRSAAVQYRYYDYPSYVLDNNGFRIARTKK